MWIQVRTMDGRRNVRIDDLSKLTKIDQLREKIQGSFEVEPERQRLFYRGKQLEDDHTLFDYDVGLNDIIQLMIRQPLPTGPAPSELTNGNGDASVNDNDVASDNEEMDTGAVNGVSTSADEAAASIGLYKTDEKVDARDLSMGSWFEAQIVKVTTEATPTDSATSSSAAEDRTVYYHVKFDEYSEDEVVKLTGADVRPRARYRMQWEQLNVGQKVMVNYNSDCPKERGFWYDGEVTRKEEEGRKLYVKLLLGECTDASQGVCVKFVDEVFRIESRDPANENGDAHTNGGSNGDLGEAATRIKKPDCDFCKDNTRRKCKHCACSVCGGKDGPEKQILCDECDQAYHLWCLAPPLESVPDEDEWYCPDCKTDTTEVIAAGEKLRFSKKKANMMSKKNSTGRDWGKGMACVGRTKQCTIVPSNHFGPIPGVPVGSMWKFRVQASESGVHRPHVAGIHGRENEGSYSIVLSGGYEDDVDNGAEFTYSGSGGRDLSGNKRTAKQSMDQKLTAMNRALARNCNAKVDDVNGAKGKDWRQGNPVRVIRNHKGSKHSKYAPKEGNRYDGIYKVVKYWPETNKSGFIVWKYLLRRDDPSPAPWSSEGKKMAKKLGLTMQYPEGYLEAQREQEERKAAEKADLAASSSSSASGVDEEEESKKKKRKGRKRKLSVPDPAPTPPKKSKQPCYELNKRQKALIKADSLNKKLWDEIVGESRKQGTAGLLGHIQDSFSCIVCQELLHQPVSTPCSHNMCKSCLGRSFKAEVYTCPNCRSQLGKDYDMAVNKALQSVLRDLFPGYEAGR